MNEGLGWYSPYRKVSSGNRRRVYNRPRLTAVNCLIQTSLSVSSTPTRFDYSLPSRPTFSPSPLYTLQNPTCGSSHTNKTPTRWNPNRLPSTTPRSSSTHHTNPTSSTCTVCTSPAHPIDRPWRSGGSGGTDVDYRRGPEGAQ